MQLGSEASLAAPTASRSGGRASWLASLAAAAALGAAAGGAVTWRLACAQAPRAGDPAASDAAGWIARVPTLAPDALGPEQRRELQEAAAASAPLRAALVDRYAAEADGAARTGLRVLLGGLTMPDVEARALALARGEDPLRRSAGLELLASFPPSAEPYAIARRLLPVEREPRRLASVLMNLRAPGLVAEDECREVVKQLAALGRPADDLVRAHQLQRLAEWDKTGSVATPEVVEALSSPQVLVRQAAVGAVMLGHLRSDPLKAALLALVHRTGEDLVARGSALQALERFPLRPDEVAICDAAQRELEHAARADAP